MKALVVGGSGFIGARVIAALAGSHEVAGTYFRNDEIRLPECELRQLDVTDEAAVQETLDGMNADAVILVCGSQSIEGCAGIDGRQAEADIARRVHVEGTRHVIEACRRHSRRLVYVSTDCVFDGSKSFFAESDTPNPFNAYGAMKRRAEQLVLDESRNNVIVRVSVTYGWRRHPRQFQNFVLRVLDRLEQTEGPVPAALNLFNTPIEVADAARAIAALSVGADRGIFHVASQERISRYAFARSVATMFGYPVERIVAEADVTGLRPPSSCLAVDRARRTLSTEFDGVYTGLSRMKSERPGPMI